MSLSALHPVSNATGQKRGFQGERSCLLHHWENTCALYGLSLLEIVAQKKKDREEEPEQSQVSVPWPSKNRGSSHHICKTVMGSPHNGLLLLQNVTAVRADSGHLLLSESEGVKDASTFSNKGTYCSDSSAAITYHRYNVHYRSGIESKIIKNH